MDATVEQMAVEPPEQPVKLVFGVEQPAKKSSRGKAVRPRGPLDKRFRWWKDLPDSADQRLDAAWALANYSECVKTYPDKPTVIEWGRAKTAPPSPWAEAMLEAAALNRQKFLFEMVPAAMKLKGEEDDPELVREERRSIAELERILVGLLEEEQ